MKRNLIFCTVISMGTAFSLREMVHNHPWLFVAAYVMLILLPQIFLILLSTREVVNTYKGYCQLQQEEERARKQRRRQHSPHLTPCFCPLRNLLNGHGIHATRAGPAAGLA